MSKKIQVVVPDPIASEVDEVIKTERFTDQSEFLRQLIRDYLNKRNPLTADKIHAQTRMLTEPSMFGVDIFQRAEKAIG